MVSVLQPSASPQLLEAVAPDAIVVATPPAVDDAHRLAREDDARWELEVSHAGHRARERLVSRVDPANPRTSLLDDDTDADGGDDSESGLQHLAALTAPYAGEWAHGHFVQSHWSNNTRAAVEAAVDKFATGGADAVPVDAVIIDAHWWSPKDMFAFHPDRFPNATDMIRRLRARGTHVVVWVSTLVPASSEALYAQGFERGYFLHSGDPSRPLVIEWRHADGPALIGCLVDLSNPDARAWFRAQLRTFLVAYGVDGIRVGGVDAALIERERPGSSAGALGHGGFYPRRAYANDAYRFFLDAGRRARGFHFLTVARAIDSFANFHFERFSPRDAAFVAWTGHRRFTFAGLRDAAMHVLHTAAACFLNPAVVVGGTLGDEIGDADSDGDGRARLVALERDVWSAEDAAADEVDAGAGPFVYRDGVARRAFLRAEQRLRLLHPRQRRAELLLRWAQYATFLPAFVSGGGGGSGNSGGVGVHAAILQHAPAEVASVYARLVREHRALAPYFTAAATRAHFHILAHAQHLADDDQALHRSGRGECMVGPLPRRHVHYSTPVGSRDWALRVGRDIVVLPALESFGNRTVVRVDCSQLRPLSESQNNGARGAPHHHHQWTLWSDPTVVKDSATSCAASSDGSLTIPAPPLGNAVALRRRGAIVPLRLQQSPLLRWLAVLTVENPGAESHAVALPGSVGDPAHRRRGVVARYALRCAASGAACHLTLSLTPARPDLGDHFVDTPGDDGDDADCGADHAAEGATDATLELVEALGEASTNLVAWLFGGAANSSSSVNASASNAATHHGRNASDPTIAGTVFSFAALRSSLPAVPTCSCEVAGASETQVQCAGIEADATGVRPATPTQFAHERHALTRNAEQATLAMAAAALLRDDDEGKTDAAVACRVARGAVADVWQLVVVQRRDSDGVACSCH